MTLALSLGISIGVRRTLWMMLGELTGVAVVASVSLAGVATLLLNAPVVFTVAKLVGAVFLLWSAFRAWKASSQLHSNNNAVSASNRQLVSQGLITAISNPKGWVFLAALLPPFINAENPLLPQASLLLVAMIVIEFICLLTYALGGRVLRDTLTNKGLGHWLNRIAASLMVAVAVWLVIG